VTTPRLITEDVPERWNDARIDAWVLCAEFVERIVSEARAEAANGSSEGVPEVDWAAIWRTGDGATSDEAAMGRIVRAASVAAQTISRQKRVAPPPSSTARSTGAGVLDTPQVAGTTEVRPVAIVMAEPSAGPIQTDVVRVEAPATPPDQALAPADLTASVEEPLTMPLGESIAADWATSARRDPPTAQVGVVESLSPLIVLPAAEEESDFGAGSADSSGEARAHLPWFHVFTWTRNVGAIILLFLVWQLWGTSISQHHAQNQLKSQFEALEAQHSGRSHASRSSLIPAATRVSSPADGLVVAEIQIPAIGVDQYVVEGTTDSDLSKGPGHYIGTAMPGQAGNVAIAGHRTTNGAPFNGLGHLVPGDRIILTSVYGQSFTYVVSGIPQAVSPSDVGVLNYFGDNRVTLTTCNPEFSSTQRLVVVGKLNRSGASPGVAIKNLSYHLVNPATASWNWSLLPAVGVAVSLLLLLALSFRRFGIWFVGISKWFVLVPLWTAGLYLLFTTLTSFFPAAL